MDITTSQSDIRSSATGIGERVRGLRRKTFAIISHPDAGKTTLTEKLLQAGGAIREAGEVRAKGNRRRARSDWMAIEQQRGISVTSSVMTFEHDGIRFNLLDTPGHEDFSEDTYRTLTAVDSAVMVLDAAKGIEAQTLKLFEVCRVRNIPIITFINKVDREGRDPFVLLDEIGDKLALDTAPMVWPLGMGGLFRGLYSLERRRAVLVDRVGGALCPTVVDDATIEDERLLSALPAEAHGRLTEEVALARHACPGFDRDAFAAGDLTPVYFGSALRDYGIDFLLDALAQYAPGPQPQPADPAPVSPDIDEVTGFIFKMQANMDPQHRDRIAFMRVCSGTLERGMKLANRRTGKTARLHNPIFFLARDREMLEHASPGDIVGIPNHGTLRVGDSLTEGADVRFTGLPDFAPEILRRVRLDDPMKTKQMRRALSDLAEEGVVRVFQPMLGAISIVGVVGALQLDVIRARISQEYGLNIGFEAAPYDLARWVTSGNESTLKQFTVAQRPHLSTDEDGALVFLARSSWDLERLEEEWPDLCFSSVKERI